MNKIELVKSVASLMGEGTTQKTAEAAVNAVIGSITNTLENGDSVVLTGFGTFKVSERSAREGRNPKTGESMHIPASKVPSFKPGKTLKDAVNK